MNPLLLLFLVLTQYIVAECRSTSGLQIVYPVLTTELPQTSSEHNSVEFDDHEDIETSDSYALVSKSESRAIKTDPWLGYYDYVITEGSFKFWAAFQLGTACLLLYSACAAIYYAKLNPITTDYDYYDDFLFRSLNGRSAPDDAPLVDSGSHNSTAFGIVSAVSKFSSSLWSWLKIDASTVQRILNAISSTKYS